MKSFNYLLALSVILLASCDVKKTESGEMPEVDVDIDTEAGKLPEYEVDWAKVNVGTRTKTVKVPKVVVVMEEEEVEVPYLDVDMPDATGEKEERTIKVEAEVSEYMYELEIEKVYATGNKLIVISELEKEDDELDGNRVRISDQIILSAPDNLMVKHYILGDKPGGDFNGDYKYIGNESELDAQLANAKLIYQD